MRPTRKVSQIKSSMPNLIEAWPGESANYPRGDAPSPRCGSGSHLKHPTAPPACNPSRYEAVTSHRVASLRCVSTHEDSAESLSKQGFDSTWQQHQDLYPAIALSFSGSRRCTETQVREWFQRQRTRPCAGSQFHRQGAPEPRFGTHAVSRSRPPQGQSIKRSGMKGGRQSADVAVFSRHGFVALDLSLLPPLLLSHLRHGGWCSKCSERSQPMSLHPSAMVRRLLEVLEVDLKCSDVRTVCAARISESFRSSPRHKPETPLGFGRRRWPT